MLSLFHRFLGYHRVSVTERDRTRLLDLALREHLTLSEEAPTVFLLPHVQKERLLRFAAKEHLVLAVGPLLGLPRLLCENRFRIGLPLGVLLAALILLFGCTRVWRLEITGNERLTDTEIEEALAALDFGVGSPTYRTGYDDLIASVRLFCPEIAWMGVYTEGMTAHVRVIERKSPAEEETETAPAHLVASDDAVILQMALIHGTPTVKVGNVVKKGDILALGLLSGAAEDKIVSASGCVTGRVTGDFSVSIPYEQTEKREIDRQTLDLSLIFFRKPLFFFKKTNKNELNYVIIERKEYFSLFGTRLPFGYFVREAVLYEEIPSTLSAGEAIREACLALDAEIRLAVGEGELLSRRIRVEETDGACHLHATVEYTKNIAVSVPFSVE